ncbi:MAG TPA: antibiotic biosynthesis monooxygenase family protein [Nitrososphaeraceae archaeon]|jgi:heme-degrading monooxygenase HmoA|nr:antibiotic biosynthesis monooxygenase family protein [Nitrososphaeraceae archaeon]
MEDNERPQQIASSHNGRNFGPITIIEMDEKVGFLTQMEENVGPVILMNKFNVNPEQAAQFLRAWAHDAAVMKRQPGFISAQLHRGIAGSGVFINYAVWESIEHFKRAYNNPEFLSKIGEYPAGTTSSPHLIKKVAVPGICVD